MKNKKPTYTFNTTKDGNGYSWDIQIPGGKILVTGWSRGTKASVEHRLTKAIFRLNKLAGYDGKPWNETARELREHMKKDPELTGSESNITLKTQE